CVPYPCSFAHRVLHSFPTRRSSDLRMEMAITGVDRMVMFFDIGFSAPYSRGNEDKPFFCTRQERSCTECAPHHRDYSCNLRKERDRKSTRLNSSHVKISYAVFCLKK